MLKILKILKYVGIYAVDIAVIMYYGLALKLTWNWFIPAAFNLNPITWKTAVGLSTVIGIVFLASGKSTYNEDEIVEMVIKQAKCLRDVFIETGRIFHCTIEEN